MNDLYRKTFDEVHASEALRQEVLNMTKQEKAAVRRQIPRMTLIAAIVALVLAGTALAAAVPGIRQWFSQQWTQQTGQPIHTDQLGLIDQLSDAVGVSVESGGVTVTVDSVTRGENVIWFLLRYDGLPPEEELERELGPIEKPQPKEGSTLNKQTINGTTVITGSAEDMWEYLVNSPRSYNFGMWNVTFDPEITDPLFSSTGGIRQTNDLQNGSMTVLLAHYPTLTGEATLLDALDVTLELPELKWGIAGLKEVTVTEGPAALHFSLPAIKPAKPLTTGGGTALGNPQPNFDSGPQYWDSSTMGPKPTEEMAFLRTQVTPTGLTVFWADEEQTMRINQTGDWYLMMADGTELWAEICLSVYNNLPDGQRVSQFVWPVPVDLGQAKSLEYRYGETVQSYDLT